jgi:(2Fe-2S) ferredoxin
MPESEFIDDCELLKELAPVAAAPIQHHVFVCTGKSCSAVDSAEVKAAFERELMARGLLFGKEKKGKNPKGKIILTECASVGFCAVGAAVMVYPDGVWYAQVRPGDVPEIVESHLIRGEVVSRLAVLKIPVMGDGGQVSREDFQDWEA